MIQLIFRRCAAGFFALSLMGGAAVADPQGGVEVKGFHAKIAAVLTEFGHLAELNGKYQLRATQVSYDPDGMMGSHHHIGPGVRCITAGELTYTILGKTTVYKPGDCFTETGDVAHDARNATKGEVRLINFEILPAALPADKGSLTPVPR
jgi:quercetin dioxygenase-like cupin family protein